MKKTKFNEINGKIWELHSMIQKNTPSRYGFNGDPVKVKEFEKMENLLADIRDAIEETK